MRRAGTSAPTASNREPALTRAACLAVSVRGRLGMAAMPVFCAAQNLIALQRVYRFAPRMSLCTVHAALHRPCCLALRMPPCSVYTALHRTCRIVLRMPSCSVHAALHRPCRIVLRIPPCTAHAALHHAYHTPCTVHTVLYRACRLTALTTTITCHFAPRAMAPDPLHYAHAFAVSTRAFVARTAVNCAG